MVGLLPWKWAEQRLKKSRQYWFVTTLPDGRPHVMPVWGVWEDSAFYFSTGRGTRKARNLARNPHCVVCNELADEAVIVHGRAKEIRDAKRIAELGKPYARKYPPFKLDPQMGAVYEVKPANNFGRWKRNSRPRRPAGSSSRNKRGRVRAPDPSGLATLRFTNRHAWRSPFAALTPRDRHTILRRPSPQGRSHGATGTFPSHLHSYNISPDECARCHRLLPELLFVNGGAAGPRNSATNLVPSGKGWGVPGGGLFTDTVATGNGIQYHNGPIMPGTVHIYFVWYGNWVNGPHASDSPMTVSLLQGLFAPHVLGGSPYAKINSTYGDQTANVTGNFQLKAAATDPYSQGQKLTDTTLTTVISNAIACLPRPLYANGVYEVLSSSDVTETSGLCHTYCGFHGHTLIDKTDIKFVFVGNTDRCPGACEVQSVTPNGDSGADGMANIMAHETEETITDPYSVAWFATMLEPKTPISASGDLVRGRDAGERRVQPDAGRPPLAYPETVRENAHGGGCAQKLNGPFYTQ